MALACFGIVGTGQVVSKGWAQPIPPAVLPGLGPAAARAIVDIDRPPWRGVVRVQTEVGRRCTGALVGSRLVLTAAHCLVGRGTGRLVRPGSVHVLSGYRQGSYAGHASAIAIQAGPGFAAGPDGQLAASTPPPADWALLTLDTPLGTSDRVLPVLQSLPPAGAPAWLGGYEQDRAEVMLADLACTVVGPVGGSGALMLRHSCAATRGASGAPLLVAIPGGGWGVAGVASMAGVGQSGGQAVPATAFAAHLEAMIRSR